MKSKLSEKKKTLDPAKWTPVRRFVGLALAVFALLALVGCLSYLFSWRQDQSSLADPALFGADVQVSNKGSKVGLSIASLLVGRWFGLGAFAVVFAMAVLAARLFFGKQRFSVIRMVLLSVTGAVLLSFILAYFSVLSGLENSFGGGLGGECGAHAVLWIENMVGPLVTFFILLFLCALWLYFSSEGFSSWFNSVGTSHPDEAKPEKKKRKSFTWAEDGVGSDQPSGEKPSVEASESDDLSGNSVPDEQTEVPEAVQPVPDVDPVLAGTTSQLVASDHPAKLTGPVTVGDTAPDTALQVEVGQELSLDVQEDLPRIDVREELENYTFPSLEILGDYQSSIHKVSEQELKRNNYIIRATLQTYKVGVENVVAVVGPTVTLYKVYPSSGVKIASIKNLYNELAMALNAKGVRIVMLSDSVGLEVPNDNPSIVPLRALLNDDAFRESKAELPVAIGVTITQKVKVFDLAGAPHLLISGATQQGKSVGLNVLIASLLYSKHPSELKFVFIDPKMVEFTAYSSLLHHYLAVLPDAASEQDEMANAVVKKAPQAEAILRSLCVEMDQRYELLSKASVNNIKLYNDKYRDRHLLPTEGHRYLPYLVTIIDEYADLTMSSGSGGEGRNLARSITHSIIRLAQKGRAAGIHIVLATQRPSVDIITGVIKTNFPTRIAFRVSQMQDSRTILDAPGAEKLIGKGDMLYYAGVEMERMQCAWISNDEINTLTKFIGSQTGYKKSYNTPYYLPPADENSAEEGSAMIDMKNLDERFEEAARMVVTTQRGSTSDLQRKLGMGYAKAGRVMDQLEAAGIVGPQEGSKPRQVLVPDLNTLDSILAAYMKGGSD